MDVPGALKQQFHAGIKMFAQAIELCPDDLWVAPNPLTPGSGPNREDPDWIGRAFWRIAFHGAYFTHLYLAQDLDSFQPPPAESAIGSRPEYAKMWKAPWGLEPYDLPFEVKPSTQADMLEYVRFIDGILDPTIEGLDLDASDCGIFWYKGVPKLSHEILNIRHLQGHVGQLSELLMIRGIDINWVGRSNGLDTARSG